MSATGAQCYTFAESRLTPDVTQNELNGSVLLMLPIKTYRNRSCSDGNRTNVMHHCHRRKLSAEDELEDVHGNKNLVENEQDYKCVSVQSTTKLIRRSPSRTVT
jgi:hypothetical protein